MSRIHYPDTAMLLDMLLEYATHIHIDEDSLFFDAIMSCTIELQQFDEYRGDMVGETSQWLIASCEAIITDKLETIKVSTVKPWSKTRSLLLPVSLHPRASYPSFNVRTSTRKRPPSWRNIIRKLWKNQPMYRLKTSQKRSSVSMSFRDIVSPMTLASSARFTSIPAK